mgnify:CR=1 FL=1
MIRNNFWRLTIVVLVLLWSLFEAYPPVSGDLIEHFEKRAQVVPGDTTISNIVHQARELSAGNRDKAYSSLETAIGTNNIVPYFAMGSENQAQPTKYILDRLYREVAGKIKKGIDLAGGTSFLVEMDVSKLADTNEVSGALSQAVEVIRKRVDRFGVAEPIIQPAGDNRILIQLPGLSEADRNRAITNLQKPAFLEFRLVHERSEELLASGTVPPGYEELRREERVPNSNQPRVERVVVKRKGEPGLVGSIVKQAVATRGNFGGLEIHFQLTPEGAERFGQVTSENIGRRLAIVLDGQLYSAPVINSAIMTGSGSITGNFDLASARELAGVLENPLRAPLKVIYSNNIDPTLGADTIRSGIKASIWGVLLVVVFMMVYYLLAGIVANIALLCNVIIVVGVMCAIGATFTMPGIAGLVLSVGMAVDANVLIYERIREERAKGKSLKGAISAGYDRAFGTIFDSHFTTLISAFVLIWMGTAAVKGFGVTLAIGVGASLFTALVITRLIFDWLLAKNLIKDLNMLHLIRNTSIDFMRWAKPAFAISWCIVLIGVAWGIKRGQGVFGVEFTGGDTITFSINQSHLPETDRIEKAIEELKVGDSMIAYQTALDTGVKTLRVTVRQADSISDSEAEGITKNVVQKLQTSFPEANLSVLSTDRVGPVIGKEITKAAIVASLLSMLGILVYVAFRYEFSFAVGAVVALVHDVLMTLGCYFLSGRELNSTTVAALLTIIGFSINDTVVIFDRIREDLKLGVRGTFRELVNRALNQTLSRTIITSGTVFLATMSLFIFGGGPVNDFAFTFLIGILVGTYSSIFIASALVLWWHKGQRPTIGSGAVAAETGDAAATAPAKP